MSNTIVAAPRCSRRQGSTTILPLRDGRARTPDLRRLHDVARRQEVGPRVGEKREDLLGQEVIDLHASVAEQRAHRTRTRPPTSPVTRDERRRPRARPFPARSSAALCRRPGSAGRRSGSRCVAAALRRLTRQARRSRPSREPPHRSMPRRASSEGRRGSVCGIEGMMRSYSVSASGLPRRILGAEVVLHLDAEVEEQRRARSALSSTGGGMTWKATSQNPPGTTRAGCPACARSRWRSSRTSS